MTVPKENGGEREDSPNHLGKEAESDYESARHSASSSQGEPQMIHDSKAKKASRVPQKLSRKQAVENLSRPTRSTSERQESTKLHFKASNNNRKKHEKHNKGVTPTKNHSDLKVDNAKCSIRASSESSEGSEEKLVVDKPIDGVLEEKHIEEVKEIDILDEAPNCDQSVGTDNEMFDTEDNSFDEEKLSIYQKVEEMELRIEKLEEELREVAALEISLYSVVPEHGSSAHKVHTPARRLSRLYIHACKHWTREKRATVAKNTVSGLVLITKSCGNDVPRLTFWLSNTVILREIISGAFGNISLSSLINKVGASNGIANKIDEKFSSVKWKSNGGTRISKKDGLLQFVNDWQETNTYIAALEKIESWIFSRVVESVWWQALTPHMQSPVDDLHKRKCNGKLNGHALGDQHQENFSIELWKNAFLDAFSRLCPLRSGGHECGCLPVLARMVMEQCVSRLDVAMFNAILRESANEIPTDPVSDPIVDPNVLPIPAGDLSFGSGAQLKNSIGNWSRWLTDLFGMDADDSILDGQGEKDDYDRQGAESKCFRLLNSLSDLLMLPKDMLLDSSIRKEVCPSIGLPLITRILCNFTPDEFCPDAVPGIVLEELNSERMFDRHRQSYKDPFTSFPYAASPVVYCSPSAAEVALKVADAGGRAELGRNTSIVQRKGYTSDEELDDLESPLASIIDKTPPVSPANGNGNGHVKTSAPANARFELLREVWSV